MSFLQGQRRKKLEDIFCKERADKLKAANQRRLINLQVEHYERNILTDQSKQHANGKSYGGTFH